MMLRASVDAIGGDFDIHAVTEGAPRAGKGIPHAEALIAFAEAVVARHDDQLANARARVLEELGPQGVVDAAGAASNYKRMVRIADATGIPLDAHLADATHDLREQLSLDQLASAANTP